MLEAQAAADVDHGEEDLERVAALMQTLSETDTGGVRDILQQVADCQVIDLGIGEERLIAFALPKMRDELALADKRFVRARLTVYALIGFLQEACECQGPYFFRTMPRISEEPGDKPRTTSTCRTTWSRAPSTGSDTRRRRRSPGGSPRAAAGRR